MINSSICSVGLTLLMKVKISDRAVSKIVEGEINGIVIFDFLVDLWSLISDLTSSSVSIIIGGAPPPFSDAIASPFSIDRSIFGFRTPSVCGLHQAVCVRSVRARGRRFSARLRRTRVLQQRKRADVLNGGRGGSVRDWLGKDQKLKIKDQSGGKAY